MHDGSGRLNHVGQCCCALPTYPLVNLSTYPPVSTRIPQIEALLRQAPNDLFLHHALALEHIKTGDEDAARASFLRNIQQDANYLPTYYHLGKLEERTGNETLAIAHYEAGIAVAKAAGDNHTRNELQAALDDLL